MKIAILADLHFRGKKLQDKIQAWNNAVKKIKESDVNLVVLAGDTFDNRNIGGREASMGTVYRAFMDGSNYLLSNFPKGFTAHTHSLKSSTIRVVSVQGNHELGTGNQMSALEPLKDSDVDVIDKFGSINDFDDVVISYAPWVSENGTRKEDFNNWLLVTKRTFELKKYMMKIIVGHLTVRGAQLNSGISMLGSEFEVTQQQLEDTGADLVALGHIHKRQWIGDKICYVGALSQDNFGEEGNPAGFLVIDTEKKTHEFVDIKAPEYRTLNGWEKFPPKLPKEGDYIKYRFKEKPGNYEALESDPKSTIEIVPDREVVHRKVEGIEAGVSDIDLLSAWLKEKGKSEEDIVRIVRKATIMVEDLK